MTSLNSKFLLNQSNHYLNIKTLLKELIEIKKAHIKDAFKLHFTQKKMSITPKDKAMLKQKIVYELKSYVTEEILPELKGLSHLNDPSLVTDS